MKLKNFNEFVNESESNPTVSFPVENEKVEILGKKFNIFEMFKDYSELVSYAFGLHVGNHFMYFPKTRELKEKMANGKWEKANIDYRIPKYKTVSVKIEFITGMCIESVMNNTKGAVSYRDKKYYVEILDHEDNLIRSYKVDRKTGELK